MRRYLLTLVIVSSLFATGCGGDWSWGWGTSTTTTEETETEEAKTERLAKEKEAKEKEDKECVLKELKEELREEFNRLKKEAVVSVGETMEVWKGKVLQAPHGSQAIESFYWANKDRFTLRGGKDGKQLVFLDGTPIKGDESDKSALIALIPVRAGIKETEQEVSPANVSTAGLENVKKWAMLRSLEYRLLSAGTWRAKAAGSPELLSQLRTETVNAKMDALLLFDAISNNEEGEHQATLRGVVADLLTEMRAIDQKAKE